MQPRTYEADRIWSGRRDVFDYPELRIAVHWGSQSESFFLHTSLQICEGEGLEVWDTHHLETGELESVDIGQKGYQLITQLLDIPSLRRLRLMPYGIFALTTHNAMAGKRVLGGVVGALISELNFSRLILGDSYNEKVTHDNIELLNKPFIPTRQRFL